MPSIAVIGAGITGVTTAYQLLNRGYDVTLFERQRYAAMETSYANGGQLSASNAEVCCAAGRCFTISPEMHTSRNSLSVWALDS